MNSKRLTPEEVDELKAFYGGGNQGRIEKEKEGSSGTEESDKIRMRNLDKNNEQDREDEEALVRTSPVEDKEKISHSAIDLFRHPVVRVKSFMIMLNWLVGDLIP